MGTWDVKVFSNDWVPDDGRVLSASVWYRLTRGNQYARLLALAFIDAAVFGTGEVDNELLGASSENLARFKATVERGVSVSTDDASVEASRLLRYLLRRVYEWTEPDQRRRVLTGFAERLGIIKFA